MFVVVYCRHEQNFCKKINFKSVLQRNGKEFPKIKSIKVLIIE